MFEGQQLDIEIANMDNSRSIEENISGAGTKTFKEKEEKTSRDACCPAE